MAASETAGGSSSSSSSGGSADSYIGSLISLTSKSEIRYEGVLFNINTEESSIGLRNVRSFGTEGRRKDGPQVPPSDKIYEYILFRGSDIKDLQVKSSPPVQNTTPIHNDPAIIQSHYPQPASTTLPSGTGSVPDSHVSQVGFARSPFQGNPPLYQPGGNLGAWGSSLLPTSSGGLAMPMYWQGFYGSSNGLQPQQQSLLQPPPGLSMLPSMQQSIPYHPMNVSIPTGASSVPSSQLSEHHPPLLPPLGTGTSNLLSPMFPVQSSAIVSESSANLVSDKAPAQTLSTTAPSNSLPLAPPLTTGLDNTSTAAAVSEPKTISGPVMPFKSLSESATSSVEISSSILKDGTMPSLVTPGQLLQPGLTPLASVQTSQTAQKDVEVVQLSSTEPPLLPPTAAAAEVQEPILPLPSQTDRKLQGPPMYAHHGGRGGRGRGRANEISRSATRFTEDFDFIAMNEKFNKDEVWDHLGKSSRVQEDGDDLQEEENVGSSKHESKPVYVKDDFFDSLSCDALDGGSRNGRTRFSEQVRRDTETFGNFPRYHGGRGGRGPFRGGRSRGSHHGRGHGYENHGGRGYSYAPRGRGYGASNRAS